MNPINPLVKSFSKVIDPLAGNKSSGEGFAEKLTNAIKDVNQLQKVADESTEKVEKGTLGIHEGMIALQEADTSLRLFLQVRSKVLSAYQEIMRIQI